MRNRYGNRFRQSGLALLTVLGLLTVITLTAVAFMFIVRGETQASRNYQHTMMVNDLASAGGQIALANIRTESLGPDGILNSGDEQKFFDSLEDGWGYGFAAVLSQSEGLTSYFSCRGRLGVTDSRTEDGQASSKTENRIEGINRPYRLGVDEDPPGAFSNEGPDDDHAPGIVNVDDDGDGYADFDDPEVQAATKAAEEGGLEYNPVFDDDEDGLMDEDGPDDNFCDGFTVGFGIDADGDRVGILDENGKLDLNYVGNLSNLENNSKGAFPHGHNQGVSTNEINPAFLLFDRLLMKSGANVREYWRTASAFVEDPAEAAGRAAQIVFYRYLGTPSVEPDYEPGAPGVDDNGNHLDPTQEGQDGWFLVNVSSKLDGIDNDRDDSLDEEDEDAAWLGNLGDGLDNDGDGEIDEYDEYPLELDGIDNDGDGLIDEPGEGIDDFGEFRPEPSSQSVPAEGVGGDHPFGTPEEFRLAAPGGENQKAIYFVLDEQNAHIPGNLSPALRQQYSVRELNAYRILQEYLTTYSSTAQTLAGNGAGVPLRNPNFTSNLVAAVNREGMEYLYSLQIDNDGDWDPKKDDHNGNGRPDGNWDGKAEYEGEEWIDDKDNDRDGLKDDPSRDPIAMRNWLLGRESRHPITRNPFGSDDGDVNKDGIEAYDPEWHVNEDPVGDANGDGYPGIGFPLTYNTVYETVFRLSDTDLEKMADDDGDGRADFEDPEVKAAMENPQGDGVDNNWNSPLWLNDGIDNDGDTLVDERAGDNPSEPDGGKDEGVDEPGEWYIPAFDDDEDGRMDEDPPEFQLIVNLIDAIDMPIPNKDDYDKDPGGRVHVPQAPDFPTIIEPIPRYSLFHVRDPFVEPIGSERTGNRQNLDLIANAIRSRDDDAAYNLQQSIPKITYTGGEAVRINEVMGCPLIRIWANDAEVIEATPLVSNEDDFFPAFGVSLDDTWYRYPLGGDDYYYAVHNWFTVLDVPPNPPLHDDRRETFEISFQNIPSGSYEMRYMVYPPEVGSRMDVPIVAGGVRELLSTYVPAWANGWAVAGYITISFVEGGSTVYWDCPILVDPDPGQGTFPRVIVLNGRERGTGRPRNHLTVADGKFSLEVTIAGDPGPLGHSFSEDALGEVWGTFGFAGLELYDPDQQYVELINVAKGTRPMVLNGLDTIPEAERDTSRWRLRQESSSGEKSEPVYVTGVIYSGEMSKIPSSERRSDFQGENISLITRSKTSARPVEDIQDVFKANFPDLADKPDVVDDKAVPPVQVDGEYQQNVFLEIVEAATSQSPNLNIFDKYRIVTPPQEGDGPLVLGGTAEAVLTLEAPMNRPTTVADMEWGTMDEIRVTADTTRRHYRGFQTSERQDPFSTRYERVSYTDQERYRATRDFTTIWARDTLAIGKPEEAVGDGVLSTRAISTELGGRDRQWLRPGSEAWRWITSATEASGGYFAETTGNETVTFFFDLTSIVAPDCTTQIVEGSLYLNVRVFGSEEIESQRRIPGRVRYDDSDSTNPGGLIPTSAQAYIGMATVIRHNLPDLSCGVVKHGETLVSRQDVFQLMYNKANHFRYILALKLTSVDENGHAVPCTFSRVEVSLSGPEDRPLVAGTPGIYNVAQHDNANRAEHWDGMMPTRGRVGFIAMGRPNEVPTLEETGKLATQLTTFISSDVPGLVNINTAPRSTLICLPWAASPVSPTDMSNDKWTEEFMRMYDWNSLMTQAVTNARQDNPRFKEPRESGKDSDGDGFIDEGPYETIGDLTRAVRTVRWMLLDAPEKPVLKWSGEVSRRGETFLPQVRVIKEIECLFAPREGVTTNEYIQERIARLEKEIFSRVSNLITVQSNVYEIITRAGVLAHVPETGETLNLATQSDRMIADRR